MPTDPLLIDVSAQLRATEQMLDALSRNRKLRAQFAEAPLEVLAGYGLTSDDSTGSVRNRVFVSLVTNRELRSWIRENQPPLARSTGVEIAVRRWAEGDEKLRLPENYPLRSLRQLSRYEAFMRDLMQKLLEDPAVRRALPEGIGATELTSWVDSAIAEMAAEESSGGPGEFEPTAIFVPLLAIVLFVAIVVAAALVDGPLAPEDTDMDLPHNLWQLSDQLAGLEDAAESGGT